MKVGFIGVGAMGGPMARNLLKAGHEVAVYNRTRSRAEPLAEGGARVADTPADAVAGAEGAITVLSDDAAVEAVTFGEDGVLAGLDAGAVHVSMSTIGLGMSRRLARAHAERDQGYVSAPVFGRPQAAESADLWIVAAGPATSIERVRPLFDAMGQGVIEAGEDVARSNVMKLAGNFLLAGAIEGMAEAFTLVKKHGIEPAEFLETINGRLFRSPIYAAYGGLIARGEYEPAGFKLRHGLKDVRLALEAAEEVAVPLPLASLVRDRFLSGVARGWGEIDWAGLGRVSAESAGLGDAEAG